MPSHRLNNSDLMLRSNASRQLPRCVASRSMATHPVLSQASRGTSPRPWFETSEAFAVAITSVLAPNLLGQLHNHAQLGPLLLLGKQVALLGRSEAALRRERELVEVDVFCRLTDTALNPVTGYLMADLRS